jgi:acyl carrier protein
MKDKIYKIIQTVAPVSKEDKLIGENAIFDSLGLVSFIVDVEFMLKEENINVKLVSEKAMSLNTSPFRTVQTLVDFIFDEYINNRNE